MVRQHRKTSISQGDNFESGDIEQAWRALGRIIARRHLRKQSIIFENTTNEDINDNDSKK